MARPSTRARCSLALNRVMGTNIFNQTPRAVTGYPVLFPLRASVLPKS